MFPKNIFQKKFSEKKNFPKKIFQKKFSEKNFPKKKFSYTPKKNFEKKKFFQRGDPLKKNFSNLHSKEKQLWNTPKKKSFLGSRWNCPRNNMHQKNISLLGQNQKFNEYGRTDGRQSLGNSSFFHNFIGNALKSEFKNDHFW